MKTRDMVIIILQRHAKSHFRDDYIQKSHFISDMCPYANVQTPSSNMWRLSAKRRRTLVSYTVFTWVVQRKVRNVALV